MATNKKGFVLYADLIHTVSELPDELKGKLFQLILDYVNDLNPEPTDLILKIAFNPIKQQLKRDLSDYDAVIATRSEGGILGNLKRWHKDLYEKVVCQEISLHKANEIAKNRTESDSDKKIAQVAVTVTDTVTVKVKDSVIQDSQNLISIWTQDLKNSQTLETICLQLSISKDYALSMIPLFMKACKPNYPNFNEFASHFKNWLRTQDSKPKPIKPRALK